MNLEPTANHRRLVTALRRASAAAPDGATAWDVIDAAGLTTTAGRDIPSVPRWGLLDWCLALEELGAAGHEVALALAVHAALDALPAGERLLEPVVERCRAADVRAGATIDTYTDRELVPRAAYAIGVGRACLERAQARAADRVISGRRLIELQGPAHRLAHAAVLLAGARIGVWRAAACEDTGTPTGSQSAACAAASVHAAVSAAHELVQVHGAAGTGDQGVVALYRAAYALPHSCGSPRSLWERAGRRWLADSAPKPGAS